MDGTWTPAQVWNEVVRHVLTMNVGTQVIAAGSCAPPFHAAGQAIDGGLHVSLH